MALLDSIKRFIHSSQRSYEGHSLAINIAVSVALLLLSLASYAFLLTLFLTNGMWTRSFIYVNECILPPTTVIPICGVVLSGATSALLSRCAEHSLWGNILRDRSTQLVNGQPSPNETYWQAQWTSSPTARFIYAVHGRSWTRRLGGLVFFGTAVLNPAPLYGVRPGVTTVSTNVFTRATESAFDGYTSKGLLAGVFADWRLASMVIAALTSMNGLNVPTTNICSNASCSASAHATTMQAKCLSSSQNYKNGTTYLTSGTRCSTFGYQTCITLTRDTLANFTSGPSTACSKWSLEDEQSLKRRFECPAGDFAVIYGLWTSVTSTDPGKKNFSVHTVDCQVFYGNATISQLGHAPVELQRKSFRRSEAHIPFDKEQWAFGISPANGLWETVPGYTSAPFEWQSSYLERSTGGPASPYTFAYTVDDIPKMSLLSRYLLMSGESLFQMTAANVARAIEANFDMATLFAFAQVPGAASITVTNSQQIGLWLYDLRALSILVLPFVATILVLSKRWRVYSNAIVVGYNPHLIAQRADEVLASSSSSSQKIACDDEISRYNYIDPRRDFANISDRATDEISLTRLEATTNH